MSAYEHLLYPTVQEPARHRISPRQIAGWLLGPFRLISKIWSCWHRQMSRPFTREGETYRACLRCGVHRRFDLEAWKTKGAYYHDQNLMEPVNTQSATVSARAKLRLIA